MDQIIKLIKTLKEIQSLNDIISVSLIDDNIDMWKIVLKYPNNNCVILQFTFHISEPLPPKAIVLFPKNLKYVCFEELGCRMWNSESNISTLLLSLHNEYQKKAREYSENQELQSKEDAQNNWEYVKESHWDWNFQDVSQLMSKIPTEIINEFRSKAKELNKEN